MPEAQMLVAAGRRQKRSRKSVSFCIRLSLSTHMWCREALLQTLGGSGLSPSGFLPPIAVALCNRPMRIPPTDALLNTPEGTWDLAVHFRNAGPYDRPVAFVVLLFLQNGCRKRLCVYESASCETIAIYDLFASRNDKKPP